MSESTATGDFAPEYGKYSLYEKQLIKDRMRDLKISYKTFKEGMLRKYKNVDFYANENVLLLIIYLYVNDIKEYKFFHNAESGTDHLKRAAYISRWISNLRPIYTDHRIGRPQEVVANVNEEFAAFVFFNYLKIRIDDASRPIVQAVKKDLLYAFRFRDPQRELLVSLARTLEACVSP